MAIEIKELIIKAEINNDVEKIKTQISNTRKELVDKEILIEECVERVLGILGKIKER